MKFNENLLSGSRVIMCIQTEEQSALVSRCTAGSCQVHSNRRIERTSQQVYRRELLCAFKQKNRAHQLVGVPQGVVRCIQTEEQSALVSRCTAGMELTTLADSQHNQHDKYLLRVYSVQMLLMMDSGPVRSMQSTLSNKFAKLCISLVFIIRIYHDARFSESQIQHTIYSLVGYQVTDRGTDFSPPKGDFFPL